VLKVVLYRFSPRVLISLGTELGTELSWDLWGAFSIILAGAMGHFMLTKLTLELKHCCGEEQRAWGRVTICIELGCPVVHML